MAIQPEAIALRGCAYPSSPATIVAIFLFPSMLK
jgi:hypothetical protein